MAIAVALAGEKPPHPAAARPPSPARGEGGRRIAATPLEIAHQRKLKYDIKNSFSVCRIRLRSRLLKKSVRHHSKNRSSPVPVLSLTSVGLILCLLGATLIMRAFAFATYADISARATGAEQTKSFVHTLCAQRIDARFGAPLLIAGFGFQLLSALHIGEKPVVMFLVLALALVAVTYYGLMRDMIATTAADAIFTERETVNIKEREVVREQPRLIEAKVEAPLQASQFSFAETTAGA
jgi:hypothetical protein